MIRKPAGHKGLIGLPSARGAKDPQDISANRKTKTLLCYQDRVCMSFAQH